MLLALDHYAEPKETRRGLRLAARVPEGSVQSIYPRLASALGRGVTLRGRNITMAGKRAVRKSHTEI